jgi:hypothetical protein
MILAQVKMVKDKNGIRKMSWVKKNANQVDFIVKMEEQMVIKMAYNEEKREVSGPVLVPERKFYRGSEFFNNTDGGWLFYDAQTIKEVAMDYIRNADNMVDLGHKTDVNSDNVRTVESWIIETPNDKAYDMGYSCDEYPSGTWMLTQKIIGDDEESHKLWQDVKDGTYKGFSLDGLFSLDIINPDYSEVLQMSQEDEEKLATELAMIVKNNLRL